MGELSRSAVVAVGYPACAVPGRAFPLAVGLQVGVQHPLGNGNTQRRGGPVSNRQPQLQLIFDELIDNKTKKGFEGGRVVYFALGDVGGGSLWGREG